MKTVSDIVLGATHFLTRNKVGAQTVQLTAQGLEFRPTVLKDIAFVGLAVMSDLEAAAKQRKQAVSQAAKLIQKSLGLKQVTVANDHFVLPLVRAVESQLAIPKGMTLSYHQHTNRSVTLDATVNLSHLEQAALWLKREDALPLQMRKVTEYAKVITANTGIPTVTTGFNIHLLHPQHQSIFPS